MALLCSGIGGWFGTDVTYARKKTKTSCHQIPDLGHLAQTTHLQKFLLCMKEIVPQNITFVRQKQKKYCVTTGLSWAPGPDDPFAKVPAVHERNSPAKYHICAPKTKKCHVTTTSALAAGTPGWSESRLCKSSCCA